MLRMDGTPKSATGYLGSHTGISGREMTEYSTSIEVDGKDVLMPIFVPGLTDDELEYLKTEPNPKDIPRTIMKKAVEHAKKRVKEGKPIFFDDALDGKEKEVINVSDASDVINKIAIVESSDKHMTDGKLTESPKGALGKYQIMPATAAKPGYGVTPIPDLRKASEADHKRFATEYYEAMLKKFDGDEEKALAAYNGGQGKVTDAVEKDPENWKDHIPSESKKYVEKIAML
jgi:hypothetical protein